MHNKKFFIFSVFSLTVLCGNLSPLFAKAPTTPKILFTSTRDGNYEVYIMNPDGSKQVNLTQHRADDLQAVWSPTGEQILFVSDRDGIRDLYLMDPDGSNVRRVFKKFVYRYYPTWAPDGKQIAHMHKAHDLRASIIYTATLGKQKEESFVNALYPAWSPDGTEIACSVGGPGQEARLVLINIRTGEWEHLLPLKERGGQSFPSWSAAGDKLAFSWNNNPLPPLAAGEHVPDAWLDKLTIYIVNRDGTGLRQIVDEAGLRAMVPTLSPNGEEVLYTQEINGNLQIFKVDVDTGVQTQLTHIKRNFGGDWFDPAYTLPVSPQPHALTTTWGAVKTDKLH